MIDAGPAAVPALRALDPVGIVFSGALDLDTCAGRRTTATELAGFATSAHYPGSPDHQRSVARASSTRRTPAAGWGTTSTPAAWPPTPAAVTDLRIAGLRRRRDRPWRWRGTGAIESVQLSITSQGRARRASLEPDAARRGHPRSGRPPERSTTRTRWTSWWRRARPTRRRVNNHRLTREEILHWVFPGERAVVSLARVDGAAGSVLLRHHVRERTRRRRGFHRRRPAASAAAGWAGWSSSTCTTERPSWACRVLVTDNEQNNHGIRRLNAELGYVPVYGVHRMRQHALIPLNRGVLAPSGSASPSRPRGRRAARRPATSGRRATRR